MDRKEQVQYSTGCKQYIEQMKLRSYFYSLVKILCEVQPDDPISKIYVMAEYLIEHLQNSKRKRLICIQSFNHKAALELASAAANKFNYKLLDIASILKVKDVSEVQDDRVNGAFREAMSKVESVYKGVIVCGYPNNLIQVNFMQQNAFLPQRIFLLPYDDATMEKHYNEEGHTSSETQHFVTRDKLNLKEIKEILKEVPDVLPVDLEKANDVVMSTLKVRDRKVLPIEAPRILVLHPPYLRPKAVDQICQRYSFNMVSLEGAFNKLKKRKQDYEKYVRKHENLSKQLQLALIQTEATSVLSKNKGLLLCGWPNDLQNFVHIEQHFLTPHIILIFFDEKQKIMKEFSQLDGSNSDIFPIKGKPSEQEFKAELSRYDKLIIEAKKSEKAQSYMLTQQPKEVLRSFQSLIANAKLYS